MDIRKLDVFRKLIELKSFTKAAEAVQLSQPTVSEHIRNLEEELEVKLVDRLGREAVPTPAGKILYQYAVRMTMMQQEALQAVAHFNGELCGELRIAASTIPGTYVLPKLLASFCRKATGVKPVMQVLSSRTVAARLLDGTVDLGMVGALWQDRALEGSAVCSDSLMLVVPVVHPLAMAHKVEVSTLANLPLIRREPGSGTRQVVSEMLSRHGLSEADLHEVAVVNSAEAMREAVKAGLGVAVMSERAVAQDVRCSTLATVPLNDAGARRPLYLLHRKSRELPPVAAAFVDHVHKTLGKDWARITADEPGN